MRAGRHAVLLLSLVAFAQSQDGQKDAQTKAQQILAQARAAIAPDAQRNTLKSLSVASNINRTIGTTHLESDIEYDILLPDKFRRRESRQPFTTVTVMQDDNAFTYSLPNPAGAGDALRENSRDPQAQTRRRADFARLLLGLLLLTPSEVPVEYSYAGEYKEPDGVADMIDATGPDGFAARLYIEQKTHQLVMLSYRGKQLSHAVQAMARLTGNTPRARPVADEKKLTPEQQAQRQVERWAEAEKRRKQFEEALEQAPGVEYRWLFSQYKVERGFNLPHHLVKSEAGHDYEIWEISSFKINPKLAPETFAIKGK
ncbi:MAG: hypothetical protein U0Y68_25230 [Blastocatellia bacterium]